MKKLCAISISTALLVGALAFAPKAQQVRADEDPYADAKAALSSLLTSPISEDHTYTKKTEIFLVSDAVHDIRDYLHAQSLQLKRATYYDEDDDAMLLMGDYDGGFASINSGYKTIDGKGHHFSYKGTANPSTSDIFTNIHDDGVWLPNDTVNTYFTNLTNIAAWCGKHYDENWTWNNNGTTDNALDDVFIYKIPSGESGDSASVELDETFHEFQQFAAPLLLNNIGAYLTPTRVVIQNAAHFLSIRLFTSSTDSGKLTLQGVTDVGDMLLAEARIFKGLSFMPEPNYQIRGSYNGWAGDDTVIEMAYAPDTNSPEQYKASAHFDIGTQIKVYDGGSEWIGDNHIADGETWRFLNGNTAGGDDNIYIRAEADIDLYWNPGYSKIFATGDNIVYKVTFSETWVFDNDPVIFINTWGGEGIGDAIIAKVSNTEISITTDLRLLGVEGFQLVRCAAGSTSIIWEGADKNVYNKTANIDIPEDWGVYSFSTSWIEV